MEGIDDAEVPATKLVYEDDYTDTANIYKACEAVRRIDLEHANAALPYSASFTEKRYNETLATMLKEMQLEDQASLKETDFPRNLILAPEERAATIQRMEVAKTKNQDDPNAEENYRWTLAIPRASAKLSDAATSSLETKKYFGKRIADLETATNNLLAKALAEGREEKDLLAREKTNLGKIDRELKELLAEKDEAYERDKQSRDNNYTWDVLQQRGKVAAFNKENPFTLEQVASISTASSSFDPDKLPVQQMLRKWSGTPLKPHTAASLISDKTLVVKGTDDKGTVTDYGAHMDPVVAPTLVRVLDAVNLSHIRAAVPDFYRRYYVEQRGYSGTEHDRDKPLAYDFLFLGSSERRAVLLLAAKDIDDGRYPRQSEKRQKEPKKQKQSNTQLEDEVQDLVQEDQSTTASKKEKETDVANRRAKLAMLVESKRKTEVKRAAALLAEKRKEVEEMNARASQRERKAPRRIASSEEED